MTTLSPHIFDTQLLATIAQTDLAQLVLKVIFVLAGGLYVLFSFVVVRQISLMRHTIITTFSTIITMVGYIHLIISVCVLLFFLVSL